MTRFVRHAAAIAPVLLVLTLWARAAPAAPAPDSAALARLRAAALASRHFRIQTTRAQFMVSGLQVDSAGVALRLPQSRPALITMGAPDPGGTRRAPWADIERIEGQHTHAASYGLIGGAVGAAAGFALKSQIDERYSNPRGSSILPPIGAAVFGLAGFLIGLSTGWYSLYP